MPDVPRRVAVIGAGAADLPSLLGDYVPPLEDRIGVTALDGMRPLAGDGSVTNAVAS